MSVFFYQWLKLYAHSSDHDGMNDRQLFDFSSEWGFFPGPTYNVLIPEDIPNVRAIF